jgi:hypothetical protein
LELQETPPQHGVLVHTGLAPPEALPAKRYPFAELSSGHEKLIGDEAFSSISTNNAYILLSCDS